LRAHNTYVNQVNRRTQLVSAPIELEKVPGMQGVQVEAATAAREHGAAPERQTKKDERANFASDTTYTVLFILLLLL
jgi:hypothetical protein